MKPRLAHQRTAALTLVEVLVVLCLVVLLVLIVLPRLARVHSGKGSECMLNLRQIGISYRMWADDNDGKYPMQVSVANGGAMELAVTGNVAACFIVMSNILDNPSILTCPQDTRHVPATNFASLVNSNISYFVGLDAADAQPQSLLSGDDNLAVNGKEVQSGILNLHTNGALAWTKERHQGSGYVLLGDGSAQRATIADLTSITSPTTNRLAIP